MSRSLVPGLLAEGKTDGLFLGEVVFRYLGNLTMRCSRSVVDVAKTQIGSCRTIKDMDQVRAAVLDLASDCHLICVHNDHRERSKVDRIVNALGDHGCATPVVPLVPVRETESWLLVDRSAWAALRGSNTAELPANPRDVERLAEPKKVLDAVIPSGRGRRSEDYFEYLGRHVDLAVLAHVPAYARWADETEKVLKGLGYL